MTCEVLHYETESTPHRLRGGGPGTGGGGVHLLFAAAHAVPARVPPQQEEEPPKYDASSLRDGRLRLFSSYDSLGGNTILCGDKVVPPVPCQRDVLSADRQPDGETNWFVCTWSGPEPAGRRSGIFDRTGEALYTFDREYDVRLSGGVLVSDHTHQLRLFAPARPCSGRRAGAGLASGTAYPVPENAYTCLVAGDRGLWPLCPGDAAPDEENDDLYQYCCRFRSKEKDWHRGLPELPRPAVTALSAGIDGPAGPRRLVEIDTYNEAGTSLESTSLLNAVTGEERSGLCHLSPRGPWPASGRRGQVSARGSGQRHDQHRAVRI